MKGEVDDFEPSLYVVKMGDTKWDLKWAVTRTVKESDDDVNRRMWEYGRSRTLKQRTQFVIRVSSCF